MKNIILFLLFLIGSSSLISAQSIRIEGKIQSNDGQDLGNVQIQALGTKFSATSDQQGSFSIEVNATEKVTLRFSLLGYENQFMTIQRSEFSQSQKIQMTSLRKNINQVDIVADNIRNEIGTINVNAELVSNLPSAVGGVEGMLKILVGGNNELVSQYTVRGGNYDENLVYVNDFEINRPFLVRSGQQEGLSFINADMVQNINFSVGGFQAKYGDKMSSMLDITYKKPTEFGGKISASLLGAEAFLQGASKNQKVRFLLGARQKTNQYLLNQQPIKGDYMPSFIDVQGMVDIQLHEKLDLQILGNYAKNRFKFEPKESSQAFGLVNQILRLQTDFTGQEDDAFDASFLGLSLTHYVSDRWILKWIASGFMSQEYERYDIKGLYALYEVESDMGKTEFGQNKYALGTAESHKFARNELQAKIFNVGHKGSYAANSHFIQWGANFKKVMVDDYLNEWHRRDSAKFSQPYHPTQTLMDFSVNAANLVDYHTLDFYVQDNISFDTRHKMVLNVGLRSNYNDRNKEWLWSPRVQWSIAPDWERNMMFKLATGSYTQPAFYREMRYLDGTLNTALKAQKSWQWSAGVDYVFSALNQRPFKITAEIYYKTLWDLVPYEYDDVRIRYHADNIGKGYAYGGEIRLFGDLVKDAESWLSIGYLKTSEKIWNAAIEDWSEWKPRPTDQRLSFGLFFSDYLPRNKNFKVYLNMLYATGLPTGPSGRILEKTYETKRLPDYKRVDIGFAALLLDGQKDHALPLWNHFKNIWLTIEVLNLLGIENTLSYQWVQDFTTNNLYAVPNKLSNRLFNLKLAIEF